MVSTLECYVIWHPPPKKMNTCTLRYYIFFIKINWKESVNFYSQGKENSLPEAVSEILATERGTLFYVLTEAGEYGIPPEKDAPSKDEKPEGEEGAFLTEVDAPVPPSKPEYIQKIDVEEAILIEVKKR